MLEAAVVVLVIAVVGLVFVALRRPASGAGEAEALRNELNALRERTDRSAQATNQMVATQLQGIANNLQTALAAMNENVARRLNENVSAMGATSKAVNDRLASVQSTFADLQKQVGEISEVSKAVTDLHLILSSPKTRGGLGEQLLEAQLAEVFSHQQYEMQYSFKSGERADAVLKFPQGLVAVDSKFPLANYRRMEKAPTEAEKKSARRDFLKDVRKHIDDISAKYILPEEGTLPFALAYIPAETVYYEAILRDEDGNDLHAHCVDRHVLPVSPNSLYAYLQTIVTGLNGMRISERAKTILRELESLRVEMDKFATEYETVGKHLRNASAKYEESERQLSKVEVRVQGLSDHRGEQLTLIEAEAQQQGLELEEKQEAMERSGES